MQKRGLQRKMRLPKRAKPRRKLRLPEDNLPEPGLREAALQERLGKPRPKRVRVRADAVPVLRLRVHEKFKGRARKDVLRGVQRAEQQQGPHRHDQSRLQAVPAEPVAQHQQNHKRKQKFQERQQRQQHQQRAEGVQQSVVPAEQLRADRRGRPDLADKEGDRGEVGAELRGVREEDARAEPQCEGSKRGRGGVEHNQGGEGVGGGRKLGRGANLP